MKVSEAYQNKLHIAAMLARLGCRAVTMTAAARIKPADSRQVYRRVRGTTSQSGQTPTDHQWFFQKKSRRMQAAFLLLAYVKYRESMVGNPDAHGLAFALSLSTYVNLMGENAEISPERWHLLIGTGFERNWRDIRSGGSSAFAADNGKVIRCRKCDVPHFVEAHYMSYRCESCA